MSKVKITEEPKELVERENQEMKWAMLIYIYKSMNGKSIMNQLRGIKLKRWLVNEVQVCD